MSATETVDLYMIARLDGGAAHADLYSCEVWYDTADGSPAGRAVHGWWGAEVCEQSSDPARPATLEDLDDTLAALGYQRTSPWRERVTAAGVVRYFADAVAYCTDIQ